MTLPEKNDERNTLVVFATKGFSVTFTGHVEVVLAPEFVVIAFFYEGNPEPQCPTPIPRSLFTDEQQIEQWAIQVAESFADNWVETMKFETERHFINIANYALHGLGLLSIPLEGVIEAQVNELRTVLRRRFHLPVGRGNFSKWTKLELLVALQGIVANKQALPWAEINEELTRLYPGRGFASGDSLRVKALEFGIKLRQLRLEAQKRRVKG